MSSLSGLRKIFGHYALSLNDLISLGIAGRVLPQFLGLGELPLTFFFLAALAIVLGPRGDRNATGPRWWMMNIARRVGISVLVVIAMLLWKTPTAEGILIFGGWCGFALFWLPPSLLARWSERQWYREAWEPFAVNALVPAAEAIMLGIGLIFTHRFWSEYCPSDMALLAFWAIWICVAQWSQKRIRHHQLASIGIRFFAASAVFASWIFSHDLSFEKAHAAIITVNGIALITPYWIARRFGSDVVDLRAEIFRTAVITGLAFLLFQPIAFPVVHGTGDASWYATMMADAMEQFRAGYFPLFGGQTVYQFNGSVYPYRVAPGFLYLGSAFDLLSWRSLGPVAVQNLLLTTWGMVGGLVCYVCVASLLPLRRWLALVAAFLFISCPGVVSIVYNTDLYMSWTTVPFVPLAFTASMRLFQGPRLRDMMMLSVSLGVLWWGHTPIALWTTGILAATQLARLFQQRSTLKSQWTSLLVGAGIFAAVASFPVGIALLYTPEADHKEILFTQATAPVIVRFLREVFPDILLPLKNFGRLLSSFQLGYTLWIVFGLSLFVTAQRKRWAANPAVVAALFLAVMLIPWPFVAEVLWSLVPGFVRNTTGNWVMNRLYLIFSSAVVVGAVVVLKDYHLEIPLPRRRFIIMCLVVGCVWSGLEAAKFGTLSARARRVAGSGRTALLPENIIVTRFAYILFPQLPAYYSHGVVDPELEHRFFSEDGRLLWSNTSAVLKAVADHDPRTKEMSLGTFSPISEQHDVWRLDHAVSLAPGRRYLLQFDFTTSGPLTGVLQVIGASLFREYELPIFGGPKSFGASPGAENTLPIWTSEKKGDEVQISLVPKPGSDLTAIEKIHVRLIEYTSDILPARVLSWLPYRVKVDSPVGGWLETPRSYQQYWTSSAGPDAVKRSPEGLTLLKHPGRGEVEDLNYNIPVGYRILFWILLATAGGVLFYTARTPTRSSGENVEI